MAKVLFGLIFATIFLFRGYATDDVDLPKSSPPINQLANVVRFFETAEICNHMGDTSTWFDDYGSMNVRFKTTIKEGENADDLCKCTHQFLNGTNWLVDVDHKCIVECDDLSFILTGQPNPDYQPNANAALRPVNALSAVLQQYPKVTLSGHVCGSSYVVQADGLTRLKLKCKLTCTSPSPLKVRQNILNYLNQNQWLGDIKNSCKRKGRCLVIEIIGK